MMLRTREGTLGKKGFKNVVFIPDGVDTALLNPGESQGVRAKLGVADMITVGVLATIGWEPRLRIPSPGWDLVSCLDKLRDRPSSPDGGKRIHYWVK